MGRSVQDQDAGARAREAVLRLLNVRWRSEKEIRDKLKKKEFDAELIDQTVQHFKKIGLIDDRRFAQKWAAWRLARPFGKARIRYELKEKGVEGAVIEEALALAMKDFPEEETVVRLAQKQAAKYPGVEREKVRQRVYGYLARRGFSPQSILKAVYKI